MKTIREERFGKVTLRLVRTEKGYSGAVIRRGSKPEVIHGDDPEAIWAQLKKEAGRHNPAFVGFDGARSRFLRIFPGGFGDPRYLGGGREGERDYKLEVVAKLAEKLPIANAKEATGAGETALSVYRALNLLSPFEQMRVQDLMRSDDADIFIRQAADLAEGDLKAIDRMKPVLARHDAAKWTVATYLPYLWCPDAHMFLKPAVTCDFAERVGHPLAHEYRAELNVDTYRSLLDLVEATRAEIADLGPRDNIDIQSFIWVVGAYEEPMPAEDS